MRRRGQAQRARRDLDRVLGQVDDLLDFALGKGVRIVMEQTPVLDPFGQVAGRLDPVPDQELTGMLLGRVGIG